METMMGMINQAWSGWLDFTGRGKFAALFLLALLYLWLDGEKQHGRQKNSLLCWYAFLSSVCCICPVTAVLLMKYQTAFYDYRWIWSSVPLTLIIAWAGTVFIARIGEYCKGKKMQTAVSMTALLALLLLSGGMGATEYKEGDTLADGVIRSSEEYSENWMLLAEKLKEGKQTVCLWAPKRVLAGIRAYDGEITLLYGRDMWDASLGAYSYDIYSETEQELYKWMLYLEENGVFLTKEGADAGSLLESTMEAACKAGVNSFLFPAVISEEEVAALEEVLGVEAQEAGEYYLFSLNEV